MHPDVDLLARQRGLRWLLVLVPAAVIAALELLSDTLLDEALPFPWDTVLVTAAVLVIGFVFAIVVSRRSMR